ncbi:hypothetical protein [Stenotrophomonas sp. Iso1]|uniref:hypothetical protein n=1 Tax=Stenotrophomonas sp. Iso1 TaxID=2977283 RepID=UPI0022B789BF|nr:hypothetical protein [Stenotrophomonas sp. Iso1]
MKKTKKNFTIEDARSMHDPDFPSTHFFYEYDREREVPAAELISHAILLWHEQMVANPLDDNSHLWEFAASLLEKDEPPGMCSRLEWLRYSVIISPAAASPT